MNKTITIAGSVIAGVALPLLGLTISPTRDAILGLAPDQAVLQLADKIDESRVSSEQTDAKIAELQSVIDSQQAQLADYQQQVEGQNTKIDSVKTENQATQAKVDNDKRTECQKKIASLNKSIANAESEKGDCKSKYDDEENKSAAKTWTENCEAGAELKIKSAKKQLEQTNSECSNYL